MFATGSNRHFGAVVTRQLALVFVASLISLSVGVASAVRPAAVSAANRVTIQAAGDTTAYRYESGVDAGAATTLTTRRYRSQVFVRFDLTDFVGSPSDSPMLGLTVLAGDASTLRVVRSDTNWDETALTWATRPVVEAPPMVGVQTAGTGNITVGLGAFFPAGMVDRSDLSLRIRSTSWTAVQIAARESSAGPVLTFGGGAATTVSNSPRKVSPLRFYTPNIIARGDNQNPARDTTADQMAALFANESAMAPILDAVDVYSFFGSSLGRGDPAYDAMLRRAIPMLAAHGVDLGLEVGGPLGYAAPVVTGADTGGLNGNKSALFDLAKRVNKVEGMGGTVAYLMLDGALRRTISNGVNKSPHAAYLTIGQASTSNGLTYRARVAGTKGNAIQIAYVVPRPENPLTVSVSGSNITVALASDSAGLPTSTAAQVKMAIEASSAASALVTVSHVVGSSGSGKVLPRPSGPLAFGDDGLNMTIEQSCAEVVEYIRTMHAARPSIRFVLLEDVILWPYNGVAGYSGLAYPSGQRPDFKVVWDELVRQLTNAGLLRHLVAMHNDLSVEYLDRLVPSANKNADDWYGRIFKQQAQVEASGVQFGTHFNSLWGGNPSVSNLASAAYFQSQVLHQVEATERYRLANRPGLGQMGHFAIDVYMFYPRVITPSTNGESTDSTYLKALALYQSYAGLRATTTTAAAAAYLAPVGAHGTPHVPLIAPAPGPMLAHVSQGRARRLPLAA